MKQWLGRIARVDLTTKTVRMELSEEYYKWLGGRGYGIHVFRNEIKEEADPLSPENKVILATGCFTGTSLPGASRIDIAKKPFAGFRRKTPFLCLRCSRNMTASSAAYAYA